MLGGGQPAADIAAAQAGLDWLAPQQPRQEAGVEGIPGAGGVDHLHGQGGGMPGVLAGVGIGTLRAGLDHHQRAELRQAGGGLLWLFLAGELAGFALVGRKHVHQPERIRQTGLIQRGGDVLAVDEGTPAVLVDEFDEGAALGGAIEGGIDHPARALGGNGCLRVAGGEGIPVADETAVVGEGERGAQAAQRLIVNLEQAAVQPFPLRFLQYKLAEQVIPEVRHPARRLYAQAMQRGRQDVARAARRHLEGAAEQVGPQARRLRKPGEDQVAEIFAQHKGIACEGHRWTPLFFLSLN